jgi:tRNA(Ile)-lysidine synthase
VQTASAEVAERAVAQLAGLGLAARIMRVDVGRDGGPEAAARTARRQALRSAGADTVLLAHTLDDQAETVLLGLGRGSGPRSISGMAVRDGVWRRPFLELRRVHTEQICRAHGLEWWTDPHNSDPAFRRSRIRAEVMPLLEDVLGGGAAEALARTASQIRADGSYLDALAADVAEPLNVATLATLPLALRSRVLRRDALEAGADPAALAAHHIDQLDRLVTQWRGQRRVELPGGVSATRAGPSLLFISTPVGG